MRIFFLFLFFICLIDRNFISADEGIPSKEQLRDKLEQALKAKDKEAVTRLYYWEGVDDEMRSMTLSFIEALFKENLQSVNLKPLSSDFKSESVYNGMRHGPNLPVIGQIEVGTEVHHDKINGTATTTLPFSQKDGLFYLTNTLREKFEGVTEKEIPLGITIYGNATEGMDDRFEGYYVYSKAGKDTTVKFNGNGNGFYGFWGTSIKYCELHKISGTNPVSLWIIEDGKKLFESPKFSDKPIIYDKNNRKAP